MQITTMQTNGKTVLMIDGELRIGLVTDAKSGLVACFADSSEIQLDLSEVSQCDTAGIQLPADGLRSAPVPKASAG